MRWLMTFMTGLGVLCLQAQAQTSLSLEDCYRLAMEQNLTIQQFQNDVRIQEIEKSTAQFQLLPSLTYDMNHYFSFGKNIDPVTNSFAFERFSGGEMGLSLRMTIFSGFRNLLSIKQEEFGIEEALYTQKAAELDLKFSITQLYADQILLEEKIKVIQSNIETLENELNIIYEKIEIGRLSQYEAYTFEARVSTEKAEYLQVKNESAVVLQKIRELLNLPVDTSFSLTPVDTSEIEKIYYNPIYEGEILKLIRQNHPALRQSDAQIKVSEMILKVANRSFFPTLRIGGSVFSNYNANLGNSQNGETFLPQQVQNNLGQYLSFNLSIPVFTQMGNMNRVKQEKINLHTSRLRRTEQENAVVSSTIQLINDFNTSRERYIITREAWEKNILSYTLQEEKYRLGKISSVELLTARDILNDSNASFLQSKLALYFSHLLLDLIDKI
ncbi:MAG TPA: TolC family protein [Lunatimonas sp.]|nr:TolC family protein [Lunatimonas sp.]